MTMLMMMTTITSKALILEIVHGDHVNGFVCPFLSAVLRLKRVLQRNVINRGDNQRLGERDRERQRQRETERDRDRHRQRQRHRHRDRETERVVGGKERGSKKRKL